MPATYKFLEPVDWLNQRLTGRFAASHDSIVVHWVTDNRRIGAIDYDPTLLRMAGLERSKLPDLVPSATIMGQLRAEAADELGLRPACPWPPAPGTSIRPPSVRARWPISPPHLYIGTSSWISCHVPFKKTDALRNVASIPAALPGQVPGGRRARDGRGLSDLPGRQRALRRRRPGFGPRPKATSTNCSTRWRPRWPRGPTALCSPRG